MNETSFVHEANLQQIRNEKADTEKQVIVRNDLYDNLFEELEATIDDILYDRGIKDNSYNDVVSKVLLTLEKRY